MGFAPSKMQLASAAFRNGAAIPTKHTGEGADVSPAMSWSDAPQGTKSFALVCHDPDAPLVSPGGTYGFVHWVLYNIPASVHELAEGTSEFTAGLHDGGNAGYMGPMPPNGHGVHHYFFWLLALDEETRLAKGLTLWQLLEKLEPHVIGMNRMYGTYQRR